MHMFGPANFYHIALVCVEPEQNWKWVKTSYIVDLEDASVGDLEKINAKACTTKVGNLFLWAILGEKESEVFLAGMKLDGALFGTLHSL